MNNKTVEMNNTFLELVKSSNNQSEKQYMHKDWCYCGPKNILTDNCASSPRLDVF